MQSGAASASPSGEDAASVQAELEQRYRQCYAARHGGRPPDLERPRLFSERVGARILRDRDPRVRVYCDKLQCKAWIESHLGPGWQPRTLAVVEQADALIPLDLPPRWMLKASHGSGWTRRIGPEDQPLSSALIGEANAWLQNDYAETYGEWAYRGLPRRLITEECLLLDGGSCPEFSVFCFAGRTPLVRLHLPHSMLPTADPASWPRECFLDDQGRLLPIERPRRHHDPHLLERCGAALPRMLAMARTLTGGQEFLRIDGYLSDGGLRVGGITPCPYAGLGFDLAPCWDAWLGAFWDGAAAPPAPAPLYDQVHVLAFNRPHYAAPVLRALAAQLPGGEGAPAVHVWIDGYAGSRDERQGVPDRRETVAWLVRRHLPAARIHRLETNIGVARVFARAEQLSLRRGRAPYALFFEDDYIPGPDYLQALELLMAWGLKQPEVAIVTAHGIVAEHTTALLPDLQAELPQRPLFAHSLWAFAIKRSHLRERAAALRPYLALMRGVRYGQRDHAAIRALFAARGLGFLLGSSQDYAKHAVLLQHRRLAVTVPQPLGRYIGRVGEHSDAACFERLGYGQLAEARFDVQAYRQALAAPLEPGLLRWSRLLELMLIGSLLQEQERQAQPAAIEAELERLQARLAALKQQQPVPAAGVAGAAAGPAPEATPPTTPDATPAVRPSAPAATAAAPPAGRVPPGPSPRRAPGAVRRLLPRLLAPLRRRPAG